MRKREALAVVVNDASCLIDLRKAKLLHLLVQLPYQLVIPLPVRESELIRFTPQEWAVLDEGVVVFDLPPVLVVEALKVMARVPRLSANDCFCLVTSLYHEGSILLTGDGQLRRVASDAGCRVHGVLWVVDELRRLSIGSEVMIAQALNAWREDPAVRLPPGEIARRLR